MATRPLLETMEVSRITKKHPLLQQGMKVKQSFEKHAKGLYFAVDEDTITSKHFFGTGVETDDEAADAIDNEKATYLIANIDVLGKSRTIGFSKKGALVLYSKPSDIDKERPYLELAIETLLTTQSLK